MLAALDLLAGLAVDLAEFLRRGQFVVEPVLPSRRVRTALRHPAIDLRRGQDRLDAAPQARRRFGFHVPDRLQHAHDGGGVHLIDRQIADWRGVNAQGHHPLLMMLGVFPLGLMRCDVPVGVFAEGWDATGRGGCGLSADLAAPLGYRADLLGHGGTQFEVPDARPFERHLRVWPQAGFALLAAERVAVGEVGFALPYDLEEQAVAVRVAFRRFLDEGGEALLSELSHVAGAFHSRPERPCT